MIAFLTITTLAMLSLLVFNYLQNKKQKIIVAYSHCQNARELLHALDYRLRTEAMERGYLFRPYKTTDYDSAIYRIESIRPKHNNEKLIGVYSKTDGMWLMISSEAIQFDSYTSIHREKYYLCEPKYTHPSLLPPPYSCNSEKQSIQLTESSPG
jgi:hypothetical protein